MPFSGLLCGIINCINVHTFIFIGALTHRGRRGGQSNTSHPIPKFGHIPGVPQRLEEKALRHLEDELHGVASR